MREGRKGCPRSDEGRDTVIKSERLGWGWGMGDGGMEMRTKGSKLSTGYESSSEGVEMAKERSILVTCCVAELALASPLS